MTVRDYTHDLRTWVPCAVLFMPFSCVGVPLMRVVSESKPRNEPENLTE